VLRSPRCGSIVVAIVVTIRGVKYWHKLTHNANTANSYFINMA
jgi:hypothetical protein